MRRPAITLLLLLWMILPSAALASGEPTNVFDMLQVRTDGPWGIHALETLDYDNDGKLDIVGLIDSEGSSGTGVLHVWRGLGDGTFETPESLGTTNVGWLKLADVNNDGEKDLVMADTGLRRIVVRLRNGTAFGDAIVTSLSHGLQRIELAFMDGDSYIDLVAVAPGNNGIFVRRGDGAGHFTPLTSVATPPYPNAVAVADFDGDGRTDIAYSDSTNLVSVVFQNANGTFTQALRMAGPPESLPEASVTWVMELDTADVNEDGLPDIIGANFEPLPQDSVMIFRSSAARTFTRSSLTSGDFRQFLGYFKALRLGDVNGDGHTDILIGSVNAAVNRVLAFAGNGDGTFNSPSFSQLPDGSPIYGLALGDFDGAGDSELALGAFRKFAAAKNQHISQLSLTSAAGRITLGRGVALRAVVAGIGSYTPAPRGSVSFWEGDTLLGESDVDLDGRADLDLHGLSFGNHTIYAAFGGNSVLAGATSASTVVNVVTDETTMTMGPFPPTVYGTPFTFSTTLTDALGTSFYGNYQQSIDGVTSLRSTNHPVTMKLAVGLHVVSGFFEGDWDNPATTFGPVTISTAKASPAMAVIGGALTIRSGTVHSLQVALTGPSGSAGPSGTIWLKRGAVTLTSASIDNGGGTLNVGTGSLTVGPLESGASDVTLEYSGDANFNAATIAATLTVLPNTLIAIDARGLRDVVSIRVVYPATATSKVLLRSPHGANSWTVVTGWTPAAEYDTTVPLRGALYDYKLTAMYSGVSISSNVDAAMLFTDDPVVPGVSTIKRIHFDELRTAINGRRLAAGLPPFEFDGTYSGSLIRISHLAGLRSALSGARAALGMYSAQYADDAAAGEAIRALHIQELRDLAR